MPVARKIIKYLAITLRGKVLVLHEKNYKTFKRVIKAYLNK